MHQNEHDEFFASLRAGKPINDGQRMARTTLMAIMGRMACESGGVITWDEAFNSNIELAPGLDNLTMASDAPVQPDASGTAVHLHRGPVEGVATLVVTMEDHGVGAEPTSAPVIRVALP